jgi:hypothetical protein
MTEPSPLSRRRFLRHTATALGGPLAAPVLAPASALGRGGLPPPSERVTMGFSGLGTQGSGHLLGGAWTYVAGGYAGRKDVQVLAVCNQGWAFCARRLNQDDSPVDGLRADASPLAR